MRMKLFYIQDERFICSKQQTATKQNRKDFMNATPAANFFRLELSRFYLLQKEPKSMLFRLELIS